ncbi:hypothetical protein [Arthrobacter dokdonensis]|uniref:hypothetical protein n=1 Tax=Arthrobacter dokdonellae TaxID=2211210 RepID=UPI001013D209|nr:hypothetical protein [Arthrobacter dokdonellae]
MAKDLLPALSHATEPDLGAGWFIQAYAISFALAIVVWGFLLLFQFVSVARGSMAGEQFLDVVLARSAVFFGGALFGPLLGVMLVETLGALTDSLISWGVGSSSEKMLSSMNTMLAVDEAAVPGGVIVGILLMICMILGLVLVMVMLVVMLVTLYFSGVVFPLGIVWFASAKHGSTARKIPLLWFGILACHPLLFFLLGVSYNMIASSSNWMQWSEGLRTLMNILTTFIALVVAGLAPLMLMKFAPVLPAGMGSQAGPSMSAPQSKEYGPRDLSSVRKQNRSNSPEDAGPGPGDAGHDDPSGQDGAPAGPEGGSLMKKLRDLKGQSGSGPADAAADTAGAGAPAGARGGAGKPGAGMGAKPGTGATPGTGAGAGAEAGAGAGAGAAEGMAAAGAAESATGVGAVIGLPTILAAGAVVVGQKAVEGGKAAARAAEAGGQYAAEGMTDGTGQG